MSTPFLIHRIGNNINGSYRGELATLINGPVISNLFRLGSPNFQKVFFEFFLLFGQTFGKYLSDAHRNI
jgi:hypothetical protein